mgnify:FL=1
MKECVQLGVNPAFGYPTISYEERQVTLIKNEAPEGLQDKFKLGRRPPPIQCDVEKRNLEEMQEMIECKDRYVK